jgi:Na+/melibiose symporter-like transporter
MFVSALSVICVLLVAYSISLIVKHNDNRGLLAFGIIYIILSITGGAFVWVLCVFHLRLSSTNTTTNEYCKKTWGSMPGNPFSKTTCFKNMVKILFGRTTRNNVDPEKIIEERKGPKTSSSTSPAKATVSHSSAHDSSSAGGSH